MANKQGKQVGWELLDSFRSQAPAISSAAPNMAPSPLALIRALICQHRRYWLQYAHRQRCAPKAGLSAAYLSLFGSQASILECLSILCAYDVMTLMASAG